MYYWNNRQTDPDHNRDPQFTSFRIIMILHGRVVILRYNFFNEECHNSLKGQCMRSKYIAHVTDSRWVVKDLKGFFSETPCLGARPP